jgi:hypothetical protein
MFKFSVLNPALLIYFKATGPNSKHAKLKHPRMGDDSQFVVPNDPIPILASVLSCSISISSWLSG